MLLEKLRIKRTPEQLSDEQRHERDAANFELAEQYAKLLIDSHDLDVAVSNKFIKDEKSGKLILQHDRFFRIENGFQIDYYVHSTRPTETTRFINVAEDPLGPPVYETELIRWWLPYDQTCLTQSDGFSSSLELIFGELPKNADIPPFQK